MEFTLFILGMVLLDLTGVVIYKEDKFRKNPLPEKVGLLKWLQSSHQWHNFGHVMMDFAMTITTGILFTVAIMGLFKLQNLFLLENVALPMLRFLAFHPILSAFSFMIPSTILTLIVEIIGDGHWRSFIGRPDDTRDFLFDMFTHLAGGAMASLFFAALSITVMQLFPLGIGLALLGVL